MVGQRRRDDRLVESRQQHPEHDRAEDEVDLAPAQRGCDRGCDRRGRGHGTDRRPAEAPGRQGQRSSARPPPFIRHGTAGRHPFTRPPHRGGMRVAIVTESFLPHVNGVTNTVRHTADRLLQTRPRGPDHRSRSRTCHPRRGHRVAGSGRCPCPATAPSPSGCRTRPWSARSSASRPDVVHLASPILLGAVGLRAARRLGIPTVAVYQTDVGAFARQYGVRGLPVIEKWVARIHRRLEPDARPVDLVVAPAGGARRSRPAPLASGRLPRPVRARAPQRRTCTDRFAGGERGHRVRRAAGRREEGPPAGGARGHPGHPARGRRRRSRCARGWSSDCPPPRSPGCWPGRARHRVRLPRRVRAPRRGRDVLPDGPGGPGQRRTRGRAGGGGPLDLVDAGRTGLLYDPTDRASLRAAVQRLVDDPDLRGAMAWRSRRQVSGQVVVARGRRAGGRALRRRPGAGSRQAGGLTW